MKTLIIYYSDSNRTELVAKTLSAHMQANLVRIRDLKRKKGFGNKIISSINAFRESKTEISPSKLNLEGFDTIYIGTPTWAGKPVPAIITIIDNCDLRGKDVILFTTMDKSGGETTLQRLKEKVTYRGGRVVECFSLKTKDKSSKQIIRDTEAKIKILDLKMYKGL